MKMKLSSVIRGLLYATAITPIVFSNNLLYPYTFGKVIFFRILIEIVSVLFLVRFFIKEGREDTKVPRGLLRHPLVAALLAFLFSALLSTVFAVNRYHAFWGDIQWGDGFFALLHYALFFFFLVYFFGKKEWDLFLGISLGVGAVAVLYAWFQYWGISHIPFALTPTSRPGSFLDNPSFFSAYLLFLIGIALLVGRFANGWLRYASFAVGGFAFLTLFITSVRGGLVGFVGGLVVFLLYYAVGEFRERRFSFGRRSPAMTASLLLAVLFAGIAFTRHAPFWENVPGLGRLVQISATDSSAQTRLIALRSSWEAFLEKPIFGWGLENYNVGYNKYYNPDYARYEEAWFDRAHNKLAEIGVMQGLLGLLAYGAIIVACWLILRKKTVLEHARPVVIATLSAYFIQNLFLFDMSTSYIMLIAFLALIVTTGGQFENRKLLFPRAAVYSFASLGITVLGGLLYFANLVPFYQSSVYREALAAKVGERFLSAAPRFLKPYTFLQSDLRPHFAD